MTSCISLGSTFNLVSVEDSPLWLLWIWFCWGLPSSEWDELAQWYGTCSVVQHLLSTTSPGFHSQHCKNKQYLLYWKSPFHLNSLQIACLHLIEKHRKNADLLKRNRSHGINSHSKISECFRNIPYWNLSCFDSSMWIKLFSHFFGPMCRIGRKLVKFI